MEPAEVVCAVEEAGKAAPCVSGESRAQRQRALAHPTFLERRGLMGWWMGEGELQQHQGKEQPRPVWGEPGRPGIPHCEELAQVT